LFVLWIGSYVPERWNQRAKRAYGFRWRNEHEDLDGKSQRPGTKGNLARDRPVVQRAPGREGVVSTLGEVVVRAPLRTVAEPLDAVLPSRGLRPETYHKT
jgi:hypothetical protein